MIDLATIHHEGAGPPTNFPRGQDGGYCIWIGSNSFCLLRPPSENWATKGYNHKDLSICFSGDRHTEWTVTDSDIKLVHDSVGAARQAWPTEVPEHFATVRAHRNSPGSQTVCPGDLAMQRWPDIVAAVQGAPITAQSPLSPPSPRWIPEEAAGMNGYTYVQSPDGKSDHWFSVRGSDGLITHNWLDGKYHGEAWRLDQCQGWPAGAAVTDTAEMMPASLGFFLGFTIRATDGRRFLVHYSGASPTGYTVLK